MLIGTRRTPSEDSQVSHKDEERRPAPGRDGIDIEALLLPAVVHEAAGMVSVQMGVDVDRALTHLREHARLRGIDLAEVAQRVIGRTLRFLPDDGAALPGDLLRPGGFTGGGGSPNRVHPDGWAARGSAAGSGR